MNAGVWHVPDAPPSRQRGPVPADPRLPVERQFAVLVSGNSANALTNDGDVILCRKVSKADLAALKSQDWVLVRRRITDRPLEELTLRRYRTDGAPELVLDTSDSMYSPNKPGFEPVKLGRRHKGEQVQIEGLPVAIWRPLDM